MNPGYPALPPPPPPPLPAVSPGAGGELSGRGAPAPALVGRPVITSGTPGATALMPTSVHSPGGPGTGGVPTVSGGAPGEAPGAPPIGGGVPPPLSPG